MADSNFPADHQLHHLAGSRFDTPELAPLLIEQHELQLTEVTLRQPEERTAAGFRRWREERTQRILRRQILAEQITRLAGPAPIER